MALDVTPVNRNLHTRVTFMALEFEDLFVGGQMGAYLQYGVPLAVIPLLMVFKYGKPRGYLKDLMNWYTRPKRYCAVARDRHVQTSYVKVER